MAGSSLIGNLAILLSMDTAAFERGATQAERVMRRTQRQFQQMGQRMRRVGTMMSIGITAPILAAATAAYRGAQDQAAAMAQVEAALTSMGGVSGRTAQQLLEASDAMELRSLENGDVILRRLTANLLTFGSVSGEVFDRAQQAILDISARLGQDLQPTTLMVGKALNDPIRGLSQLRRVGIQFTEAQEQMIRRMVGVNDIAGAQGIMLAELERQFGGAAQAAADTEPMRRFWVVLGQIGDRIGEKIIPLMERFANVLVGVLDRFNRLSPGMQNFLIVAVGVAAAIGPLLIVFGSLISGVGMLLPWVVRLSAAVSGAGTAAGAAAGAGGFAALLRVLGPIGLAATAALIIFRNWDEITTTVANVEARIRDAGGAAEQAAQQARASRGGWDHFASAEAFQAHFWQELEDNFVGIGRRIQALDRDLASFSAWVDRADAAIASFARNAWGSISRFVTDSSAAIARLVTGIRDWLGARLNAVWDGLRQRVEGVRLLFRNLYQAVVGGSYIPDMVDEIGQHMARLQQTLVAPARNATRSAADAFRELQAEVSGILERLFPLEARENQLARDIASIEEYARRAQMPVDQLAESISRLRSEFQRDIGADTPLVITAVEGLPSREEISGITEGLRDLNERALGGILESFGRMGEATRHLARDINDVIEQGLRGMMRGFVSLKDIALEVLFAIGDALISNLMTTIGGVGKTGGIGGAIASAFSGLFGGGRAMGGPVTAGRGYIVGERGPEWFTPSRSGSIVPNREMSMGGRMVLEIRPSDMFLPVMREQATSVVVQYGPLIKQDTLNTLGRRSRTR